MSPRMGPYGGMSPRHPMSPMQMPGSPYSPNQRFPYSNQQFMYDPRYAPYAQQRGMPPNYPRGMPPSYQQPPDYNSGMYYGQNNMPHDTSSPDMTDNKQLENVPKKKARGSKMSKEERELQREMKKQKKLEEKGQKAKKSKKQ